MAVTYDSTFEKGTSSQASPFSFASNAGDVTGSVGSNSNRVLIGVFLNRAVTATAVAMTWNGVSMTSAGTRLSYGAAPAFEIHMFYLVAPDTGNQTISVSWTGGSASSAVLGATSVYGADQSTAIQNYRTDTGTGTTASSTLASFTAGNMAIAAHSNNDASSTTIGTGTSTWVETDLSGNYAMGRNTASGVISWTLGTSVLWGNVELEVIAAGGGASTAPLSVIQSSEEVFPPSVYSLYKRRIWQGFGLGNLIPSYGRI